MKKKYILVFLASLFVSSALADVLKFDDEDIRFVGGGKDSVVFAVKTCRITKPGDYEISGEFKRAQIIVEADNGVVNLKLSGLTIDNREVYVPGKVLDSDGDPCYEEKGGETIYYEYSPYNGIIPISLIGNCSTNIITEGENFLYSTGSVPAIQTLEAPLTFGGDGSLTVEAKDRAPGIGIGDGLLTKDGFKILQYNDTVTVANITINSGKITALGGNYGEVKNGYLSPNSGGSGIGACYPRSYKTVINVKNIVINGGEVIAKAGRGCAGIGTGVNGVADSIVINGGKVAAYGGYEGAGIGSGEDVNEYYGRFEANNIILNGGEVEAYGGAESAGIGGGQGCGAKIIYNGGDVKAYAGGWGKIKNMCSSSGQWYTYGAIGRGQRGTGWSSQGRDLAIFINPQEGKEVIYAYQKAKNTYESMDLEPQVKCYSYNKSEQYASSVEDIQTTAYVPEAQYVHLYTGEPRPVVLEVEGNKYIEFLGDSVAYRPADTAYVCSHNSNVFFSSVSTEYGYIDEIAILDGNRDALPFSFALANKAYEDTVLFAANETDTVFVRFNSSRYDNNEYTVNANNQDAVNDMLSGSDCNLFWNYNSPEAFENKKEEISFALRRARIYENKTFVIGRIQEEDAVSFIAVDVKENVDYTALFDSIYVCDFDSLVSVGTFSVITRQKRYRIFADDENIKLASDSAFASEYIYLNFSGGSDKEVVAEYENNLEVVRKNPYIGDGWNHEFQMPASDVHVSVREKHFKIYVYPSDFDVVANREYALCGDTVFLKMEVDSFVNWDFYCEKSMMGDYEGEGFKEGLDPNTPPFYLNRFYKTYPNNTGIDSLADYQSYFIMPCSNVEVWTTSRALDYDEESKTVTPVECVMTESKFDSIVSFSMNVPVNVIDLSDGCYNVDNLEEWTEKLADQDDVKNVLIAIGKDYDVEQFYSSMLDTLVNLAEYVDYDGDTTVVRNLRIYDNQPFNVPFDLFAKNVEYVREFDGDWSTLYMPFSPTKMPEDLAVMNIDSINLDTTEIFLAEIDSIEANVPYIIQTDNKDMTFTATDVFFSADSDSAVADASSLLIGTYNFVSSTDSLPVLKLNTDGYKFSPLASGDVVNPFRAYIPGDAEIIIPENRKYYKIIADDEKIELALDSAYASERVYLNFSGSSDMEVVVEYDDYTKVLRKNSFIGNGWNYVFQMPASDVHVSVRERQFMILVNSNVLDVISNRDYAPCGDTVFLKMEVDSFVNWDFYCEMCANCGDFAGADFKVDDGFTPPYYLNRFYKTYPNNTGIDSLADYQTYFIMPCASVLVSSTSRALEYDEERKTVTTADCVITESKFDSIVAFTQNVPVNVIDLSDGCYNVDNLEEWTEKLASQEDAINVLVAINQNDDVDYYYSSMLDTLVNLAEYVDYGRDTTVVRNLRIYDNQPFGVPFNLLARNVEYVRQFDGEWSTLYMPFSPAEMPEGLSVMIIDSINLDTTEIFLADVEAIEANVPYIIQSDNSDMTFMASDVFFSADSDRAVADASSLLIGTYNFVSSTDSLPVLKLNSDGYKFSPLACGDVVNPFRAYIPGDAEIIIPANAPVDPTDVRTQECENSLIVFYECGKTYAIANADAVINIANVNGTVVKTLTMKEGEKLSIDLETGVYLANGIKFIVR